ncbi:MAG: DUF2306 domain-containing protein [Pararhodobacter sp.]
MTTLAQRSARRPRLMGLGGALALAMVLAITLYGALAIDAGFSNWRSAANPDVALERRALMEAAEADRPIDGRGADYNTLGIVSAVAPDRYTYGRDGLMETLIWYSEMPRANAVILSVHNVLAGLCLLFAGVQFWPGFRRRHPVWHRRFGVSYVAGIQIAMLAAVAYLLLTPVAMIYDQLTFAVMLWFLALAVTASIWMAMVQLWRGNIPQHMGYMSIGFGLLLTAPVLRFGWVFMGWLNPEARQIESNFAINGILIPASFLIGYAIFTANRALQPRRNSPALLAAPQPWPGVVRVLIAGVAALALWLWLRHGIVAPGLDALSLPPGTVPQGVLDLDRAVTAGHPLTRWLLAVSAIVGIGVAASALWQRAAGRTAAWLSAEAGLVLAMAGLVHAAALLMQAEVMGMPGFATLTGGSLALFGGLVTLAFSLALALALRRGWGDWADEWGGFVLTCLLAAPAYWLLQPWIAGFRTDPAFREAGHLFRIAGVAQWTLLLVPFLFAIHGRATTARLSR